MHYLTSTFILLLSSMLCYGGDLKIQGTLTVPANTIVKLKATGFKDGAGCAFTISPRRQVSEPSLQPDNGYEFTAPEGTYEVTLLAIKVTDKKTLIEQTTEIVTIGGPTPTPGPTPGPTPTPVPPVPISPIVGKRVLIVFETSEAEKLTEKQQEVLYGKKIRTYLDSKCDSEPDGKTKGWKVWDKDIDTTGESKVWQDAMKRPRTSLPWIIIGNGTTGYEGPLPATTEEALALITKYLP